MEELVSPITSLDMIIAAAKIVPESVLQTNVLEMKKENLSQIIIMTVITTKIRKNMALDAGINMDFPTRAILGNLE